MSLHSPLIDCIDFHRRAILENRERVSPEAGHDRALLVANDDIELRKTHLDTLDGRDRRSVGSEEGRSEKHGCRSEGSMPHGLILACCP